MAQSSIINANNNLTTNLTAKQVPITGLPSKGVTNV